MEKTMLQKYIILIIAFVLLAGFSAAAETDQTPDSVLIKAEQLQLPEHVKTVLVHEMTTITRLMGDLLEYIARGDINNSSAIALEIRDTNLKQEFDADEIRKIMKILPKGFIKLDRNFHSNANELSKAVNENDFKTAINLYSEMTQGCFNCHAVYAKKRFPNLQSE